jgi:hypothetical protein
MNTVLQFTNVEIAELLVKKAGLHEGWWRLGYELKFSATSIGPSQETLTPAGVVAINGMILTRVVDKNNLTVDAAEVNPENHLQDLRDVAQEARRVAVQEQFAPTKTPSRPRRAKR